VTNAENPAYNGWITAKGGIRFDLLNPTTEQLDITTIAHALGNVCRFSGHTARHFSVAQHSVLVSYIAAALGLDQDAYDGLMHDAQEAYVGDVPTPLKRMLPEYREIEDRLALTVAERFEVRWPLPAVVKQADLYALFLERDELMREQPEPWEHEDVAEVAHALADAVPMIGEIVAGRWTPSYGAVRFYDRFLELAPAEARTRHSIIV
jgi:uncharacterized protein